MAAPTTPILDDFNRTGGGAPLGANWTTMPTTLGFLGPRIGTNNAIAAASGQNAAALWNVALFGADQEAYLTLGSATGETGIFLRMTGAVGTPSGYAMTFSTTDGLKLYRWDSGRPTQLGTTVRTDPWVGGDQWMMQAIGSGLAVYRKPSGGSWSARAVISATDRTHAAGGSVGLYLEASDSAVDDFGGGALGGPVLLGQASESDEAGPLRVAHVVTLGTAAS